MIKICVRTGAIFALIGILLGAFGAHILRNILDSNTLSIFDTAVKYQMYHSFALIITGLIAYHHPAKLLRFAGWFFTLGIILFSGSLYAICFSGIHQIGLITPFGGFFFLAGWICIIGAPLLKFNLPEEK